MANCKECQHFYREWTRELPACRKTYTIIKDLEMAETCGRFELSKRKKKSIEVE